MKHITKGKNIFGNTVAIMVQGDQVWIVSGDPNDFENRQTMIVPKSVMLEFLEKLR